MASDTILVFCPKCNASLRAPSTHIGKTGKCRKCGASVLIQREGDRELPLPPSPPTSVPPLASELVPPPFPPTAKQIDFAESLGIEGVSGMTKREVSKRIGDAILLETEEHYRRLDEIEDRESRAYEEIRADIVAHMAETDPQVSLASPRQMVSALEERNVVGVLVTYSMDDVSDVAELGGVNVGISFPVDQMTKIDVIDVLITAANALRRSLEP